MIIRSVTLSNDYWKKIDQPNKRCSRPSRTISLITEQVEEETEKLASAEQLDNKEEELKQKEQLQSLKKENDEFQAKIKAEKDKLEVFNRNFAAM